MSTDTPGRPTPERRPPPGTNWLKRVKFAIVLVIVVVALIILFQNNEKDAFDVLFWRPQVPRSVLLLIAFGMGAAAGAAARHFLHRRRA